MRILLTRAKADAERTAMRLAALGHTAIISPVIEIVPTGVPLPGGPFDAIIATSAHAFTGDVRALADTALYVVGERTREAAGRAGWTAPIHVSDNAAALVACLRADSRQAQHVFYLAGRDRKPDIEAAAQEIGISVHVVETYAAREILHLTAEATRALRAGEVDAAMHYSRRSAELFRAAAERAELWEKAVSVRHLALSPDVAEPLVSAGAQTCVAAEPNEDQLVALLAKAGRQES